MKNILSFLVLNLALMGTAQADALSPSEADSICRAKALKAAHFLAESNRKFILNFRASDVAEISTPITYELRYSRATEALYTVVAFAYPDNRTCLIGSVTNNIAGND
jgi:hypothetical protein